MWKGQRLSYIVDAAKKQWAEGRGRGGGPVRSYTEVICEGFTFVELT